MPNKIFITLFLALLSLLSCSKETAKVVKPMMNFTNGTLKVALEQPVKELDSVDLLKLNFKITFPLNYELQSVENTYGDFEFYDFSQSEKFLDTVDRACIKQQFTLEPGLPGEHKLPALTFAAISSDGKSVNVKTAPLTFMVNSILPENYNKEEIQEMAILEPAKGPDKSWMVILPTLLLISLAISFSLRPKTAQQTEAVQTDFKEEFSKLNNSSAQNLFADVEKIFVKFLNEHFSLTLNSLHNFDVNTVNSAYAEKISTFIENYEMARYSQSTGKAADILQNCEKLVGEIQQGGAA